jgi:hypothetical protein
MKAKYLANEVDLFIYRKGQDLPEELVGSGIDIERLKDNDFIVRCPLNRTITVYPQKEFTKRFRPIREKK